MCVCVYNLLLLLFSFEMKKEPIIIGRYSEETVDCNTAPTYFFSLLNYTLLCYHLMGPTMLNGIWRDPHQYNRFFFPFLSFSLFLSFLVYSSNPTTNHLIFPTVMVERVILFSLYFNIGERRGFSGWDSSPPLPFRPSFSFDEFRVNW